MPIKTIIQTNERFLCQIINLNTLNINLVAMSLHRKRALSILTVAVGFNVFSFAQSGGDLSPCLGDSSIDYFGYTYDLVEIDNYCFFAENLKTHQFQNGDSINQATSMDNWSAMVYPWGDGNPSSEWDCMVYPDFSDSLFNIYGGLYNKFASTDPRNLCPSGYHVPHRLEFQDAVNSAGGADYAGGDFKTTGTIETGTGLWYEPNTEATNLTGFSAIPAGQAQGSWDYPFVQRGNNAHFFTQSIIANSLTQTELSYEWANAGIASVYYNSNDFSIPYNGSPGDTGRSIRCVKNPALIGCMDSLALDFNPNANVSGPCNLEDCTNPDYINFGEVTSAADGCFVLAEGGPCMGQGSYTYFGKEYPLIEIAGSCWFAKNLDTDFLNDSTDIPLLESEAEWELATGPGRCSYNFSDSLQEIYGQLYHGMSVFEESRLCPQGWVVPSRQDWEDLKENLDEDNPGGELKTPGNWVFSTGDWNFPNRYASNATGFNALPGGRRYDGDNFQEINGTALFLSSTHQETCCGTTVFRVGLNNMNGSMGISDSNIMDNGASVRCTMRPGCIDANACNFNSDATYDNGECSYPEEGYNCSGACITDSDNDGICNEFEIPGCTIQEACNFQPEATDNDGACVFPSEGYDCSGVCLEDSNQNGICDIFECDETAYENGYEAGFLAGLESCDTSPSNESCGPGTYWDEFYNLCLPNEVCAGDLDDDGIRGTSDLLLLLAYFGSPCE